MRILIAGAIAAVGLSSPALADKHTVGKCFDKATLSYVDCPRDTTWSGFYIGAHAGYFDSDFDGRYDDLGVPVDIGLLDVNGGAYGGQLGFNHQYNNNLVVGLELDASIADGEDSVTAIEGGLPQTATGEIVAFGSLRARLGLDLGRVMPFVTGGVGLVNYELRVVDNNDPGAQTIDETVFAGVVGGGLEFMLTENILLRGEGLYYFFDDDGIFDITQLPDTDPNDFYKVEDLWTIRGAINYKF